MLQEQEQHQEFLADLLVTAIVYARNSGMSKSDFDEVLTLCKDNSVTWDYLPD